MVERHLREKQVYRIDHYLGKDTVNNILATRFSNILLEPLWNRQYIEEIQIFATETIGCEGRSQYYETAGAVRDMLQNHILQVLALIAMEPPSKMNAKEVRREKTQVLAATRLGEDLVCGQYEEYNNEEGVDPYSRTPTFVAGSLYVDNWRWEGVPFRVMTGKKMPYQCVEVVIKLKSPPLQLYDGETKDRIVMRCLTLILTLGWILSPQGYQINWNSPLSPTIIRRKEQSMDMRNSFMMLYLVINRTLYTQTESWSPGEL